MKTSRIALIALTTAAVLGVAACGSDSAPSKPDDTVTMSSSESSTSEPSTSSESSSESATGSQSPDSDNGVSAAVSAIDAAESETGGTAYEVDDENGSWEIDLAKDGTSIEVEISADGKATEHKKEDLDANDRQGLAVAKTTIAEGIEKALDEIDGTFDEAGLEEQDGTYYWEVEIVTGSDEDHEVLVDVTNGKVTVKN